MPGRSGAGWNLPNGEGIIYSCPTQRQERRKRVRDGLRRAADFSEKVAAVAILGVWANQTVMATISSLLSQQDLLRTVCKGL